MGFKCNSKLRSIFKNLIYNYKDKKITENFIAINKKHNNTVTMSIGLEFSLQKCNKAKNFTIKYTMPV